MANTYTQARAVPFGGPVGKSLFLTQGTLVIDTTANGGAAAGDLPASMFGLNRILSAVVVNDDNSKNFVGTPAYNGESLLIAGGASNAPMDLPNDTYLITVIGY